MPTKSWEVHGEIPYRSNGIGMISGDDFPSDQKFTLSIARCPGKIWLLPQPGFPMYHCLFSAFSQWPLYHLLYPLSLAHHPTR